MLFFLLIAMKTTTQEASLYFMLLVSILVLSVWAKLNSVKKFLAKAVIEHTWFLRRVYIAEVFSLGPRIDKIIREKENAFK